MKILIDVNETDFNIQIVDNDNHKEAIVKDIDYIIESLEPVVDTIHDYLYRRGV